MGTVIECGKLFTGTEDTSRTGQTLRIENGTITSVRPSAEAPPLTAEDTVLDYSNSFVMPGLIDTHVHLSYGNAKTEETSTSLCRSNTAPNEGCIPHRKC